MSIFTTNYLVNGADLGNMLSYVPYNNLNVYMNSTNNTGSISGTTVINGITNFYCIFTQPTLITFPNGIESMISRLKI